jgi:hypothetical protein
MIRTTLRQRVFPLHQSSDVAAFLNGFTWSAVFKAGTSDKTFDAWDVVAGALERRPDVAVGVVRLPEDRSASDAVAAITGIEHRSPQLILLERGNARLHLDELAIVPDRLLPALSEHLPPAIGDTVRNDAVLSVEPYRALLRAFLAGELPEERFQWAYLERLEKDAVWRDDETFTALDGLFVNPAGRELRAARLVALEFQSTLAGTAVPLRRRAVASLQRLAMMK